MVNSRSRLTGIAAGLVLGAAILVIGGQLSQAEPARNVADLTGEALAEQLGLQLVSQQPSGCNDYIVVEGPDVGYCLEGKVSQGLESWDVGRRLAGIVPTEQDRQVFELQYELAGLSPRLDRERVHAILLELRALQGG